VSPLQMRGYKDGVSLMDLPPIAQRIIEAAIRILERDGFPGLTYEAIGVESGEYKDSIRYYFGGKDGLIEAVFDALWHDTSLQVYMEGRQTPPGMRRIESTVYASRSVVKVPAYHVMWEILPHVLRNEKTRDRVADLYELYRAHYLDVLGIASRPGAREDARDCVTMMLAMMDGLAIQHALDPERVDLDRLYARWSSLIAEAASSSMAPQDIVDEGTEIDGDGTAPGD
jgi:AcrR family transcriptional regulator